jgi:hypothetical protein
MVLFSFAAKADNAASQLEDHALVVCVNGASHNQPELAEITHICSALLFLELDSKECQLPKLHSNFRRDWTGCCAWACR